MISDDDIRRAVSHRAFAAGVQYQLEGRVLDLRASPDGRAIDASVQGSGRTPYRQTIRLVPDGYVFREPYPWPFTQSPHYLVNEAQRDKLLAITVPKRPILWQIALWGALCLMVVGSGFVVWAFTRHENPTLIDFISMLVLTFVQVVVTLLILRWRKLRELRPILANLPTTDLRITRSDMQRQTINATSTKQLILLGAINVMACWSLLISGIVFLVLGQSQGILFFVGALLFGVVTIVYYRRLIDRVENIPDKAATSK